MNRSISKRVSNWLALVSKGGALVSLCAIVSWPGTAGAGLPDAAPVAGDHGSLCPACNPQDEGPAPDGDADEDELVFGCLSDADCGEQGLCVKEGDASEDEPGDCVLSADGDDDWHAEEPGSGSAPVEQPAEKVQCSQSQTGLPGGAIETGIFLGLNALVALRRRLRRRA